MMKQGWQPANAAQMLAKIGQVGVETAIAAAEGKSGEPVSTPAPSWYCPLTWTSSPKDSGVVQFMKAQASHARA